MSVISYRNRIIRSGERAYGIRRDYSDGTHAWITSPDSFDCEAHALAGAAWAGIRLHSDTAIEGAK